MQANGCDLVDSRTPGTVNMTLVFYTRTGCHLCDVAKEELDRICRRIPFRIEVRDVDEDEAWAAQYGDEVPVGVLDGRKIFKYRVDVRQIERALRATKA